MTLHIVTLSYMSRYVCKCKVLGIFNKEADAIICRDKHKEYEKELPGSTVDYQSCEYVAPYLAEPCDFACNLSEGWDN